MSVNVKMGVDLGGFKSGIREGQQILKGLNAEMKSAEAEFKATGNAEQLMSSKTKTLTSQMNIQKSIISQTQQALKMMVDAGVNPADKAYQQLYAQMMNAQAGMYESQAALNALGQGANEAAAGADKLTSSVQGISKKISLEQVISGVEKIRTGLENAAKKAIELGQNLWDTIMDSARRADDTATMAEMYGIDLDTFMRMQKLVAGGLDTSVEAILKSMDKMKKGVGKDSKEVMEVLSELGIGWREGVLEDWTSWQQKSPEKMFWEAGQAIMAMGDAYDKEAAAQALFGKSWKELVPLFKEYKTLEEYQAALDAQNVTSEEAVRDLAALNDAVSALEGNWTALKDEMLGAIAPALTKGAEAISGLLDAIIEYVHTDEGKKMLEGLSTAVSGLFEDLGKIDPDQVVSNFVSLFTKVTGGIQWLVDNQDAAKGVLGAIVGAWGVVTIGGTVLQVMNFVNGLMGLAGGGAAAAAGAGAAGSAAGSAFAAGFSGAFAAAAPVLASLLGIGGLALGPAIAAQKESERQWAEQEQRQREAAERDANNRDFLLGTAGNRGYDFNPDSATGYLYGLGARQNQARAELFNMIRQYAPYTAGYNTTDLLMSFWKNPNGEMFDSHMVNELLSSVSSAITQNSENAVKLPTELVPEDGAAAKLSEQVGDVTVNATLKVSGIDMGGFGGGGNLTVPKANGIAYVPYDGYLAMLHKGERVVPAREVASRNFSSNLYVENMNMGGGTDANALAAMIASRNQRMMAGYGS